MPREIEEKLKREAEEKFPGDIERQNAYVYGTLRNIEQDQDKQDQGERHPIPKRASAQRPAKKIHWYFRPIGAKRTHKTQG